MDNNAEWEELLPTIAKKGLKISRIALALGVAGSTLYQWRKMPTFPPDKLELVKAYIINGESILHRDNIPIIDNPDWAYLKEIIKRKGIKIDTIAKAVGVTRKAIYVWMGNPTPPPGRLEQVRSFIYDGLSIDSDSEPRMGRPVKYFPVRDLSIYADVVKIKEGYRIIIPDALAQLHSLSGSVEIISEDHGLFIKPIKKSHIDWRRVLEKAIRSGHATEEELLQWFKNNKIVQPV